MVVIRDNISIVVNFYQIWYYRYTAIREGVFCIMEKIREATDKKNIVKYYRYEEIVKPVEFLEELAAKGWKFDKVFMKRDAEMDMQFDIGNYTLDELRKFKASLAYGPACMFTLEANLDDHFAEIHFSDDSKIVYMFTTEPDFELE